MKLASMFNILIIFPIFKNRSKEIRMNSTCFPIAHNKYEKHIVAVWCNILVQMAFIKYVSYD